LVAVAEWNWITVVSAFQLARSSLLLIMSDTSVRTRTDDSSNLLHRNSLVTLSYARPRE
jgi:hypothetical protein